MVLGLSFFCIATGTAFDFGALLGAGVKGAEHHTKDSDTICNQVFDFRQVDDVALWMKTPLNKKGNVTLSAQGSFSYDFLSSQYRTGERFKVDGTENVYYWNYSYAEDHDVFDYKADLDLLKLTYNETPATDESIIISLGRFGYNDTTNLIFTQNCDGMLLQYFSPQVNTSFYAGYTGLLNQRTVSMLSKNEDNDYIVHYEIHDKDRWYKKLYDWADPYFASAFAISFPYLFCNQTLSFEINTFFGSRGPSKVKPGSDSNRYYLTTNLSGPLDKRLTYSLGATLFTEKFEKLGLMTQANLSYFFDYKNLTFTLSSLFATGGSKNVERFQTFTSNPVSYAFTTQETSGVIKWGVSGSIKPVPTFYVSLGADLVNSCAHNLVRYHGWQWYGIAKLQCTADCQISLTGYSFYGKKVNEDSTGVTLKITLAF